MPLYSYQCRACCTEFDEFAKLADYEQPQPCPSCGAPSDRVFGDRAPGFILQGDGWPGKNLRVQGQMARKNERLRAKEREWKKTMPSLVPNVNGEQTGSWADAAKLAKDRGKDTTGYDAYARREKS